MAHPSQTFLQEASNALRGCIALITAQRDSASWFDFSQRGLVGSFIALVLATAVSVFGPQLLGVAPAAPGTAATTAILAGMIFAIQLGAAYATLSVLGRLDGLVPYIVADNWVNFFVSVIGAVGIVLFGGATMLLLVIGLVSLVVEVNIARRIITLAPMQVAIFIVVQIVAQLIGVLVLGGVLLQASGQLPAV